MTTKTARGAHVTTPNTHAADQSCARLPLTATQKLQRGELKALARGLPGTPKCIDTRHLKKRH